MQALQPFTAHAEPIGITGKIELVGSTSLQLEFRLSDPERRVLDSLRPHLGTDAFRADVLWHTTCFEAFWGIPGEPGYWELNLAASQPKWNLYRFENYRQPQPPQESRDYELTNWEVTPTSMLCLLKGKQPTPALEASLCVIARTGQGTHFYSTSHAGAEADYHLRKSFTLKLTRARA